MSATKRSARLHDLKWHTVTTWYCNAKVFRWHLPLWGLVQVIEYHACNRYERKIELP